MPVSSSSGKGTGRGERAKRLTPVARTLRSTRQRAGKSVYLEIVDALKVRDSAAVTVTRTTPPPQVTDQQAAAVLKKMAGQWDLDYTRNKERVTIRERWNIRDRQ